MIHQVGPDGGVQIHFKSDLEFGTDAIHARHQHRVGVFEFVHHEQSAKTTDLAQHAASEGFVREILDPLLGAVGAADIDSGVGVGHGFGCGLLRHGEGFLFEEAARRDEPEAEF